MLPAFFQPLLEQHYAPADVQRILDGSQNRRAVTLRANTLKATQAEVATALDAAGIAWEDVPWYHDAFCVVDSREKALWDLPLYQEGKIYLQSLSSMLPPKVLDPRPGADILDMCAAPGGKTTQLAALSNGAAHLTACELNAIRADKLEYNLQRQGAKNVQVMRVDARKLDDFFRFDQVLLDAPCSGSGTLWADDPKVGKRFNEGLIQKCQKSQRALLDKALGIVKPGGCVVYATCSVLPEENQDSVASCLKKASKRGKYEVEPIAFEGMEDLPLLPCGLEGALCLCPTDRYEGFFVAKIKRTA